MPCLASSGFKISALQIPPTLRKLANGLSCAFGSLNFKVIKFPLCSLPRLNGLWSPFGIEREQPDKYTTQVCEAKWAVEPVRVGKNSIRKKRKNQNRGLNGMWSKLGIERYQQKRSCYMDDTEKGLGTRV